MPVIRIPEFIGEATALFTEDLPNNFESQLLVSARRPLVPRYEFPYDRIPSSMLWEGTN
jgi:hypothetical protein